MKAPLDQFAARIARSDAELKEFINGLIDEHMVSAAKIRQILDTRPALKEEAFTEYVSQVRQWEGDEAFYDHSGCCRRCLGADPRA